MRDQVGELLCALIADVARSDGRPSAEEIVARLKAIKSAYMAMDVDAATDEDVARAFTAPFQPNQPITATHPRAVREDSDDEPPSETLGEA